MSDFTLTDYDERPITIGTRVAAWSNLIDDGICPNVLGTVTDLGEWDADYCDELQRGVEYPPRITVQWDDGTTDKFVTSEWETRRTGYYEYEYVSGMVEEISAIEEEKN